MEGKEEIVREYYDCDLEAWVREEITVKRKILGKRHCDSDIDDEPSPKRHMPEQIEDKRLNEIVEFRQTDELNLAYEVSSDEERDPHSMTDHNAAVFNKMSKDEQNELLGYMDSDEFEQIINGEDLSATLDSDYRPVPGLDRYDSDVDDRPVKDKINHAALLNQMMSDEADDEVERLRRQFVRKRVVVSDDEESSDDETDVEDMRQHIRTQCLLRVFCYPERVLEELEYMSDDQVEELYNNSK